MFIYQNIKGDFLSDSSQPISNEEDEITSSRYTPHQSTRYIHIKIGDNGKAQRKNQQGDWLNVDKDLPELYRDRQDCCGCYACSSVCPANAISMKPDEEGFLYPIVDAERCIRCYKCLSVCDFQQREDHR